MAPEEERSWAVVLSRLDYIEERRKEDRRHFDATVTEFKADVRSSIAGIAYVSKEQFVEYKALAADRDKETRDIATDARSTARAALWVLIIAVVGAVVGLAFQVAA